jgi:hypothetical protein
MAGHFGWQALIRRFRVTKTLPVDGLVVVYVRIQKLETREPIIRRLCDIGEMITPVTYELNTSHWDDGLWDNEVAFFRQCLEGTRDRMFVWRVVGDTYTRFTITGIKP